MAGSYSLEEIKLHCKLWFGELLYLPERAELRFVVYPSVIRKV